MAATEDKLGSLHEKVANVLIEALEGDVIPGYEEENPNTGEITHVPDRRLPASAAIIAAATKFLKDNNITCAPSEGNAMGALVDRLREKQKAKVSRFAMKDAIEDTSFMGGLQ